MLCIFWNYFFSVNNIKRGQYLCVIESEMVPIWGRDTPNPSKVSLIKMMTVTRIVCVSL